MTDRHPDDAMLQAAADGVPEPAVALHLGGCEMCRGRVAALQRETARLEALLATLDHPLVPPIPATELFRRPAAVAPRRWLRVALAGGLTVATALAAAALPSSPVHRWLARSTAASHAAAAATAVAAPAQGAVPAAGVVIPHPVAMTIVVQHAQQSGTVVVTVGGGSAVSIGARGGDVAYDVSDSGVTVRNRLPATEYDISLPLALESAPIYVGSTRIYPTSRAAEPDSLPGERRYRITLGPSGP